MLTNPPVPYDPFVNPNFMFSYHGLDVKVLVGAFNQEKALVGSFSVIVKSS